MHKKFESVGDKMLSREPAPSRGGPQNPRLSSWSSEPQMSWREDAGMRTMSQRGWAPRPPVEQPRRTGKKRCYGHRSGGQYVAVLFSLQLTSHTVKPLVTFQTKWGVYFSKEVSSLVLVVLNMFLHVYVYV